MASQARRPPRSRGWSIALAVLGAVVALVGGFLFYARQEIFNPDNLAERSKTALGDERTRLAIAQPIVDGIVDSGSGELVNARPLVESIVVSALGTPPAKAAFAEAVRSIDAKLANRAPDTLFLNLTDATVVAAKALDALNPEVRKSLPKEVNDVKAAILDSELTVTPIHWVHQVDVFGIVLPFLALLLLALSVVVAPVRRTAVQRAAIAVAVAAVVGLIVLIAGRALALAQIADPLYSDAAAAAWDAVLGDLTEWTIGIGLLALILAAAARFDDGAVDPLRPLTRAAELARRHPKRPALGVLRGVGIGLVGLLFVVEPDLSLHLIAIAAGAWLIYVAIIEILAIIAPIVPAGESRAGSRRFAPMRLAGAAAVIAGAVVVVLVIGGDKRSQARPPGAPEACNGYPQLCAKRIDQVTIPATHNAMSAAAEPGWFLPNQRYGIVRQLDDGIRGLLIDSHYGIPRGEGAGREFGSVITDLARENKTRQEVVEELGEETVVRAENLIGRLAFGEEPHGDAEPYLCHVICELGATKLGTALAKIDDWLRTHPDEFLVIVIEDYVSPEETAQAFERTGLLHYAYTPEPAAVPPTLGELIERDKRLMILAEHDNGDGKYPWYQSAFDLIQETPYTFKTVDDITGRRSCRENRGDPDNPLFQINNWIEKVPRDPGLQGEINALDVLGERAQTCRRVRGMEPNVIAVDYYNEGDVIGVAKALNGIPDDEEPQVRTLR
ncbi:MAG TPA: hypothetical protein VFH44_11110 [Solirubrobacterales bacterium]|nr:hypothetical protein [Solirubrobacterales bacterium]